MRNIFSSFILFFLNRRNMRLQREIETMNKFTSSFFKRVKIHLRSSLRNFEDI